MNVSPENLLLAQILTETNKCAILSNDYEDGEAVLDSALYTISRIIRRVTTIARDIPYYGLGDHLPEEVKKQVLASDISNDPEQFSWSDDPIEAMELFKEALADPPSRAIIEGVLISFKEQRDFKETLNKSRSQREAEMD